MNHYGEAIAAGIVTAVIAWVAGAGAGRPTMAATPPSVSAVNPYPQKTAFDSAQARLAKAQWQYEIALRNRMRTASQLAAHKASREDLDASWATVERASATVRADRATLEAARSNLLPVGQIHVARDLR